MVDEKPQRFDFDPASEGNEIPTLTSLLYKKNLVKADGYARKGRLGRGLDAGRALEQDRSAILTLDPTVTTERPLIEDVPSAAPPIEDITPALVHSELASNRPQPEGSPVKGGRRERSVMPASPFTMPEVIRAVAPARLPSDAIARAGIQSLASKTKLEACIVFEERDDGFVARSIVAATNERSILWTGMELSKTAFSDLLGRLQKFGFAEFSTVGAVGQGNFDRAGFRSAFQAKTGEWITLVRVKSARGGDAIVACFTPGSIQMHLPAFHSAGLSNAA